MFVRALGRPALAGSPRDGLGNRPPIVFALASVAGQLWDAGSWTGQGEADLTFFSPIWHLLLYFYVIIRISYILFSLLFYLTGSGT